MTENFLEEDDIYTEEETAEEEQKEQEKDLEDYLYSQFHYASKIDVDTSKKDLNENDECNNCNEIENNYPELSDATVWNGVLGLNKSLTKEKPGEDEDQWDIDDTDVNGRGNKSSAERYYLEDTLPNIFCFNCGLKGHIGKNCEQERKEQTCNLCGIQGHVRRECPNELCYNCMSLGHRSKECNEERRKPRFKVYCKRCKFNGHEYKECTEIWRQYHATTELGTIKKIKKYKKATNPSRFCYNCASSKHFGEECKYERSSRGSVYSQFIVNYDECTPEDHIPDDDSLDNKSKKKDKDKKKKKEDEKKTKDRDKKSKDKEDDKESKKQKESVTSININSQEKNINTKSVKVHDSDKKSKSKKQKRASHHEDGDVDESPSNLKDKCKNSEKSGALKAHETSFDNIKKNMWISEEDSFDYNDKVNDTRPSTSKKSLFSLADHLKITSHKRKADSSDKGKNDEKRRKMNGDKLLNREEKSKLQDSKQKKKEHERVKSEEASNLKGGDKKRKERSTKSKNQIEVKEEATTVRHYISRGAGYQNGAMALQGHNSSNSANKETKEAVLFKSASNDDKRKDMQISIDISSSSGGEGRLTGSSKRNVIVIPDDSEESDRGKNRCLSTSSASQSFPPPSTPIATESSNADGSSGAQPSPNSKAYAIGIKTLKNLQNILETDDDEDDEAIYSSSRGELASIDPQVYFQEQFSGDEDDEDDEDDHFDKWGAVYTMSHQAEKGNYNNDPAKVNPLPKDLTYYDPRAVYQEHLITYNLIKPTRNLLEPTADRFHFISGPSSNTRGQKAAKRLLQYDPAAYTTASTHQRKMTKKETIKKNQAVLASKRQELLASKSNATDFNQILEQLHFNARSDLKGVASEEVIEKWTASEQGYLSDLRNNTVEPTKNQKKKIRVMGDQFFRRLVAQHVCQDSTGNSAARLRQNIEMRVEKNQERKMAKKNRQGQKRSHSDKLWDKFRRNPRYKLK